MYYLLLREWKPQKDINLETFSNSNLPKYTTYITKENDRWDTISWKFYGNSLLYQQIIEANPTVAIKPTLTGGIRIKIPNIVEINKNIELNLPPWKKGCLNGE